MLDPKLLRLLCALVFIRLNNNILFWACHSRGTKNILADHLSHLQIEIQSSGIKHEPSANTTANSPTIGELGHTLMLLLVASLSTTSLNTYCRPGQLFCQFCSDRLHIQGPIFPILTEHLALFIAFLAGQKYAASTVLTYISALSFPHRLASLLATTKMDMNQLALQGYSKTNPCHLLISLPLLEKNISACNRTHSSMYSRKMTQAMYSIVHK